MLVFKPYPLVEVLSSSRRGLVKNGGSWGGGVLEDGRVEHCAPPAELIRARTQEMDCT